ncbi:SH3 domain-containing protein [Anaerococcus ihuae]|uniref:SH3 domain-containing protein n=1 Tax=Anaerococcus ihuae TaxID=2899519 RepID=UPI001F2CDB4D|nr:SH3 domain-containing protein [Anaerococcus ihuae]
MKFKKIICLLVILISLSSCKAKKEKYQSKNVEVDTIFDSDFSYDNSEEEQLENLTKLLKQGIDEIPNVDEKEKKDSNLEISKGFATKKDIEFRKDPLEDEDNIIGKIPKNTKVEIIKNVNVDGKKWSKISYNGNKGYVKRSFLKEIE